MPAALADRPQVAPWAEPYWRAFLDLARERHPGPPPRPIPLAAIRAWLAWEQVGDPALRDEFRRIVILLDTAWLDHAARSRSPAAGSSKGDDRP
jgi:hypothetical protein